MSSVKPLYILGMGAHQPETLIDNKFIENLNVGTNEEWILDKIGIVTRRSSLPLDYIASTLNADPRQAVEVAHTNPLEMGAEAARIAMERAGVTSQQIKLLICNCCTPDTLVPTESRALAERLGIDAETYEVYTACPAVALHLDLLNRFADLPEYVLCVSTATLTQNVNYKDRSDGAIWGDGAAAWVVSMKHPGRLKVLDTFFMSDPVRCDAVVVDTYGFFHQDGRAVRDFSVRQTVRLIKSIEARYDIDWERDIFVGHQANKTMLDQITNNRGIPEENHWHNVTEVGNQAGAGAPASIAAHWDEIRPGQRIVVAVVGAGLSWGSVLLEAQPEL